jgi:hypothetical protein
VTALDVLRVVAWPLVVLVVALGVFKRLDAWRDLRARLSSLEARCVVLESNAAAAAAHARSLEKRCDEDRGVTAHTAESVAAMAVQIEKVGAKVESILIAAGPRARAGM